MPIWCDHRSSQHYIVHNSVKPYMDSAEEALQLEGELRQQLQEQKASLAEVKASARRCSAALRHWTAPRRATP